MQRIAAERRRQIEVEGWTETHDDQHDWCQLPLAAVAYAMESTAEQRDTNIIEKVVELVWPFGDEWWKPSPDPIRNLEKAGALIAAEIDRLQRAVLAAGGDE